MTDTQAQPSLSELQDVTRCVFERERKRYVAHLLQSLRDHADYRACTMERERQLNFLMRCVTDVMDSDFD